MVYLADLHKRCVIFFADLHMKLPKIHVTIFSRFAFDIVRNNWQICIRHFVE